METAKMYMIPYTGIVDTEENWRAEFERHKSSGGLALWDEKFRGLDEDAIKAALIGYDPIRDSDLVAAEPDGAGNWRVKVF